MGDRDHFGEKGDEKFVGHFACEVEGFVFVLHDRGDVEEFSVVWEMAEVPNIFDECFGERVYSVNEMRKRIGDDLQGVLLLKH